MRHSVDCVITPRWIIPVEPLGTMLEDHSVVFHHGLLVDIAPTSLVRERFAPTISHELPEHVVLPGLINLHAHAAMALLKGIADDLPLMNWLQEHIWPAEGKYVSPSFVKDGSRLAFAEMLRGGITCCNDMYMFPDAAAEAAVEMGIRLMAGIILLEFPTPYAADASDYLEKGLRIRDQFSGAPRVGFTLAPHAPYTVSDRSFERIRTLADQLGLQVHLHIHETLDEIANSLKEHGARPLDRLNRLGYLNDSLIGVHAVHLNPDEISVLGERGSHIAHCPSSNLKLASGIAPVVSLLKAGVNVGLGTDSAASNNRLDLFQEMRTAALLAKGSSGDATAVDAHGALAMATINGAKALGLDAQIGSLLPGKAADLIAVKLDSLETTPMFDVASHLVYCAGREHVTDVWVAGEHLIREGQPTKFAPRDLIALGRSWQNRLRP